MYKDRISDVSVSSVLDTRKPNKDGLYAVRIQVTHKRVQRYINTGKFLSREEWEKLPNNRSSEAARMRQTIKVFFDLATACVQELTAKGEYTFERLCVLIGKDSGGTLNGLFKAKIQELLEEKRIGTMNYYESCLASVTKYKGDEIPIGKVTVEWLKKYEQFCLEQGNSYATLGMRMRGIRTMMNIAKQKQLIKESQYPFGKNKYEIKAVKGKKKALPLSQIAQVINYKCTNKTLRFHRDIWYFIYLCNGINMADLVNLKYENIIDGEINFIREKTKRTAKVVQPIIVPVTPPLQEIIDRWGNEPNPENYVFNLIKHYKDPVKHKKVVQEVIKDINQTMKFIGSVLGIGDITTYTARHSFATVLKRSGANIAYISESLGHSDIKTTESYLASFEKDERIKNASLLTNFK